MTFGCTLSCNANLTGPTLAEMCGASTFVVFMSLLDELVRSNEKISGACQRVKPTEEPDDEYDFVVIGGGGAGAVVAGRLSENPDWKVLVLEAGPDEPAGAELPMMSLSLLGTEVDWQFATSNESHGCLSGNGSCRLAAGKMLGGSTSHNSMIYLRGNPTDYNNWAALGNKGWTWDEVKPFFLKSEHNGEIDRVGRKHHATGGPLWVERFSYLPDFGYSILDAADQAGYTISDDLNGDQISGFSVVQATVKKGTRQSSSRAFLWPARNRTNLHVALNSPATRVIIKNGRAVGVEYRQSGDLKEVRVSREVVISAGAVKSPQILLLSGIGPKEHLESVGVKVVKDSPGVGENFQNHVGYRPNFSINETETYDNDYETAAEYVVNQTGPLSSHGLDAFEALLCSDNTPSCHYPDVHFYFGGYNRGCAPGEVGTVYSNGTRTVTVFLVNMHPKSRGRISLVSKDPFQDPVIWGNYLEDHRDVQVLITAIKMLLSLVDTQALHAHDFTLSNAPLEACSNHEFLSDEYWACAIRQDTATEHHTAGSCKMGPSSDSLAVVDPRLRVYGIKGLRVADASIIPQLISGNTAATAMMIGERAADFIKKDWARKNL